MFGKKPAPTDPQGGVHSTNPGNLEGALNATNRLSAENTKILGMLAQDYLKERKSKRRWGWVFKGLLLVYLGATLFIWYSSSERTVSGPHTALVELDGLIGPGNITAEYINGGLRKAFKASDSVGVILRINSPGGTPVQAAKINAEIKRLKAKYPNKPFHAVVDDVGASGGYYVAVAADKIYAHPSSIVGSIGVRMDTFGFVNAMDKLGVERRLITAGDNKAILDPFSPISSSDVAHAEKMLAEVHNQFIEAVKLGRGDRLKTQEDLFSGLFWSGERALELGLIDEFGSVGDIARDVLSQPRVVSYNPKRSLIDQFSRGLGASISAQIASGTLKMQ